MNLHPSNSDDPLSLVGTLPPECFVPFYANKARLPTIIWRNPELPGLSLEHHAYFAPLADDELGSYETTTRSFLGERYGGDGLGANGGGVRCGLAGGVQVKGIGKNALAGSGTNFFHAYGGATLNEAILEAIWGEVCHLALPFGGVRALGILGTGTRVPLRYPKAGEDTTTARALLVRESPLRPAHYMRAIFLRRNFHSPRLFQTQSAQPPQCGRFTKDSFSRIDGIQTNHSAQS